MKNYSIERYYTDKPAKYLIYKYFDTKHRLGKGVMRVIALCYSKKEAELIVKALNKS